MVLHPLGVKEPFFEGFRYSVAFSGPGRDCRDTLLFWIMEGLLQWRPQKGGVRDPQNVWRLQGDIGCP